MMFNIYLIISFHRIMEFGSHARWFLYFMLAVMLIIPCFYSCVAVFCSCMRHWHLVTNVISRLIVHMLTSLHTRVIDRNLSIAIS